jgi:hypothetical protein
LELFAVHDISKNCAKKLREKKTNPRESELKINLAT